MWRCCDQSWQHWPRSDVATFHPLLWLAATTEPGGGIGSVCVILRFGVYALDMRQRLYIRPGKGRVALLVLGSYYLASSLIRLLWDEQRDTGDWISGALGILVGLLGLASGLVSISSDRHANNTKEQR